MYQIESDIVLRKYEGKEISPVKKIVIGVSILIIMIILIIYQNNTAKAWSNRIYPGVKIENQDLSGKTRYEAKNIMKQKYKTGIIKNKLNIKGKSSTYTLEISKIDPKYNIDETVDKAFNYGKDRSLFKKFELIKFSPAKQYDLKFTYNYKVLDELIEKIKKDVNKEPVNATLNINGEKIKVVSEKKGEELQSDKLKSEILSKMNLKSGQDIQIPMKVVNAKITSGQISSINSKISEFSTEYGSMSSDERANNIMLATQSVNGKILMPGDTFSFNNVVGERTAQRGYEAAPVIIGDKVDSGLGGGICQVSTTLYNAVIRANIKSTERTHHTLPSHYVKLGMDATVDYGSLDYKFKNTLKYPIYIEGDASGGMISFNIYSNKSLANVITNIDSQVCKTVKPGIEYVDDPTLKKGETEVVTPSSTGYEVKVTKITTQNGRTISQGLIADDYYEPVDAVIKRGTKEEENKPAVNQSAVAANPPAANPGANPGGQPNKPDSKPDNGNEANNK